MRVKERVIIEEILVKLKPKLCLEWGSGYSTSYFPDKHCHWQSIEHDKEWFEKMKLMGHTPNVVTEHIPANIHLEHKYFNDGNFREFENYITRPSTVYDFILIDGRARIECLKWAAANLSSPSTVVVLHDANRSIYRDAIPMACYKHQEFFTDVRFDSGGIWIGSNTPLHCYLNIEKHRKIWNVYKVLGL